jgi:GNAT superfamily N-acetyltransferase
VQGNGDCATHLLSEADFDLLAGSLGDSPETVISVHNLRRRQCRAFAAGAARGHEGAVVQIDSLPSEPAAYGSDARVLSELMKQVKGWECVNVNEQVAQPLAQMLEERLGVGVKALADVYYELRKPVVDYRHHDVREAVPDDLPLLEAAPRDLRGSGFGTALGLLEEGVVFCGIISGRVVATAHTCAISGGYADIGVFTSSALRGRGFATACASQVAARLQAMGLVPVWSAAEYNTASNKTARKLGFEPVSRRVYLSPGR